jgi:hypothetical protein
MAESEPKAKSGLTPIRAIRSYGGGLARDERRVRTILKTHGDDPDMALAIESLRRHYLALGKELREVVRFDVQLRREIAEARDAEYCAAASGETEMLDKLLKGANRRAGNRKVSLIKTEARNRIAAAGLDPTIVDALIDDVPEMGQRLALDAMVRQADKRIDSDLDAMRADVDGALAASEEDPDGDDGEIKGDPGQDPLRRGGVLMGPCTTGGSRWRGRGLIGCTALHAPDQDDPAAVAILEN